jgi:HAD superfamily hydrolase (TIGR01490 family)
MGLAVFDIDGTLVTGPSTEKRFALHLARSGRLGPRQVLAFLAFLPRQAACFGRHVLKKDKAYLAGLRERDMRDLAAAWVTSALQRAWFEPCLARLRRHHEAGDVVVLLSGTPQFVAAAIGGALGVEHVIGSECAVSNGRFLAQPPVNHPFGDRKVAIVADLARLYGVDASEITAYGDSIHDLPLFMSVGKAIAVRPDEALATVASEAGWETLGPVRRGLLALLTPWRSESQADLPDRG